METRELLAELHSLDIWKAEQIKDIEDRFKKQRKDVLDRYAKDNAKFKVGDIIAQPKSWAIEEDEIIRIEWIETDLSVRPHIRYVGQHLLPDLTEGSTSGKYSISTLEGHPIEKLTKPKYVAFLIQSESHQVQVKSYRQTLDICRDYLTGLGEDVTIYGIKENGETKKLRFYPSLKKYGW